MENAMNKGVIEVKGVQIGAGKPVICVPVVASDADGIVSSAQCILDAGIRMVEWRVDLFEGIADPQAVMDVLERLRPLFAERILLFTIRTAKQGGQAILSEKEIIRLNETAAATGVPDFVDLEFFEASKPQREIRRLQDRGVKVIASHHDFEATPEDVILHMLADQMSRGGADVMKLAVMPCSVHDTLRLLQFTADTKEKYPDTPLVTMAMGGTGVLSRLCGELTGSCITFGAIGDVSAPGKLQADELQTVLDIFHKGLGN